MYYIDAYRLLAGCDGLRTTRRGEAAGVRRRARNTDLDALLEKTGLVGRARKV